MKQAETNGDREDFNTVIGGNLKANLRRGFPQGPFCVRPALRVPMVRQCPE